VREHYGAIEVESPVIDPTTRKQLPGTAFHMRFPATEHNNPNDEEHQ
jgi:hypothetical protein